jgi:GT2 family glycosyltransferase
VNRHLSEDDYEYLGCNVKVDVRVQSLAAKYDAIHAFRTDVYFTRDRFVPTCCLSVRRALLERVGLFQESLESGGDWEFSLRAEQAGARKRFAGDVTISHPARTTVSALLKKRMRLGRGAAQRNRLDPARFKVRTARLRDYLPSNPLRIKREAMERGIEVSTLESVMLSAFKPPLTWAYWNSFARELRRLDEPSKRK